MISQLSNMSLLATLLVCASSTACSAADESAVPVQEKKFCDALVTGIREGDRLTELVQNEKNPLRVKVLQEQADQRYARTFQDLYDVIGPSGQFVNWKGHLTIRPAGTAASVEFGPGSNNAGCEALGTIMRGAFITLATVNYSSPLNTLIPLDSPLGKTLGSLDLDKNIIASGNFVWAAGGMKTPHLDSMIPVDPAIHFVPANPNLSGLYLRLLSMVVRFTSFTQGR